MARPKLVVIGSEYSERSRESREGMKYRFELSRKKLIFAVSSLVVALCWMFFLGVVVGRGIALVSSDDFSIRAQFMRFLGLDKQTGQPAVKAAETWGDPKKMLESLNYYEDLTQKGPVTDILPPRQPEQEAVASLPPPQPQAEKAPTAPAPEKIAPAAAPEKAAPKPAPVPPPGIAGGQFTLLVASLKDPENAQRLIEQLSGKGYSPRLETLDLHGGGRWNRVLVGSFQSRESALKFAAEFNKKESMEGLVIRESN